MKITNITKEYYEVDGEKVYFFEPLEKVISIKELQKIMDTAEEVVNKLKEGKCEHIGNKILEEVGMQVEDSMGSYHIANTHIEEVGIGVGDKDCPDCKVNDGCPKHYIQDGDRHDRVRGALTPLGEQLAEIKKKIIMNKKYQIIYADPPWSYNDTQKSGGTAFFGAGVRYPLMKNKDIANLPINDLADKDCILFLWATSPLLPEAFETIKSWGFKYKTVVFCWNKQSKNGKWISNMGRWTMGNVEVCLLAIKGKPKRICKNIKQLVIAERKRHSEKPEEVANRIVDLMGDLPRIELFARNKRDGWDVWGNEVENDITL